MLGGRISDSNARSYLAAVLWLAPQCHPGLACVAAAVAAVASAVAAALKKGKGKGDQILATHHSRGIGKDGLPRVAVPRA